MTDLDGTDEELAAIGIRTRVSHAQHTRPHVFHCRMNQCIQSTFCYVFLIELLKKKREKMHTYSQNSHLQTWNHRCLFPRCPAVQPIHY